MPMGVGNEGKSVGKMDRRKKTKMDLVIEAIDAGRHSSALRNIEYLKRSSELVREIVLDYKLDEKEKFLQATVPRHGKYVLHVIAKRGSSIFHRFYLKEASVKSVKSHQYWIISMRVPAELRNSRLYIKVYRLKEQ